MSFYGKNFKKTKMENVDEFMDLLKVPEKVRLLVKNMDMISSFKKNGDGSIHYGVSKDGVEVFSQKITPGVDAEFTTPDGETAKVHFELKGNALESVITFPNGNTLHMDRVFEGSTMQQIAWKDGTDLKSTTYYEAI